MIRLFKCLTQPHCIPLVNKLCNFICSVAYFLPMQIPVLQFNEAKAYADVKAYADADAKDEVDAEADAEADADVKDEADANANADAEDEADADANAKD